MVLFMLSLVCYVVILFYKAKIPRFKGPEALGFYLIFASALTLATIPGDPQVKGIGVINYVYSGKNFLIKVDCLDISFMGL